MEPVTHFLTGACIGRAGLNRKTAYATLAAVLASEAADLDILWSFGGPVEELKHHRGITHTFIAAPVLAGVVVGAVWLLHRWREGRRKRRLAASAQVEDRTIPPLPQEVAAATRVKDGAPSILGNPARGLLQPVRWGWLYLTALIAALLDEPGPAMLEAAEAIYRRVYSEQRQ